MHNRRSKNNPTYFEGPSLSFPASMRGEKLGPRNVFNFSCDLSLWTNTWSVALLLSPLIYQEETSCSKPWVLILHVPFNQMCPAVHIVCVERVILCLKEKRGRQDDVTKVIVISKFTIYYFYSWDSSSTHKLAILKPPQSVFGIKVPLHYFLPWLSLWLNKHTTSLIHVLEEDF